ncbi:HNH endonuclease [Arthrobacter oryzae]|uniref:5-methylcytosine-specific restriction protein A n=1 Tax=Arthrobacter oryzae TaxID=409290 RepID=A0A495ERT2_9MICC|nr:HNH endonuclease [Arthrobacter oryzae]RKR19341.1 5-methylcytosine-specific restriction protein A [Arthrobacter oryzae]
MTAIILVWNPDEWNEWTYPSVLDEVAETGCFLASWEVGGTEEDGGHAGFPGSGTEAWLVFQGRHGRGLIGHGVIVSERPAPRLDEPGAASAAPAGSPLYVRVAFDALLPAGDQIPPGVLKEAVPGVDWDALHGSGLALDPSAEPLLRGLWSEFGPPGTDPTQPVPGTVPAAAVSRVEVNRYEHSPDARRACIAHHGTSCAACGFSFEIAYGEIGKEFVPVHHLVPVSQLGSHYELDPITDLVPLCANCHAMAHHGVSTPRTVAELRRIMAAAGHLAGHVLTENELQAQQDARRILNQHSQKPQQQRP